MVTGGSGWSQSCCPEISWRLQSKQPELISKRSLWLPEPPSLKSVGPHTGRLEGTWDFELVAWLQDGFKPLPQLIF